MRNKSYHVADETIATLFRLKYLEMHEWSAKCTSGKSNSRVVNSFAMAEVKYGTRRWFDSSGVSVEQYFFFSSLALVLVFAWMEPAGAAGIGFWKGLIFWTVQISILIPLLIAVQHLASHYVTFKAPQAPWIQTALSGLVSALIFVPIAYSLDVLFAIPESDGAVGVLHALLDEASGVVVPVTVTWLALNAPWILQLDFSKEPAEIPVQKFKPQDVKLTVEAERPTRFLQELRSRAGGELLSISSELHYVRVVTTDTEVMFLYNLRDAVEELPSDAGVQIHRSHWVSKRHVKDLTRRNGSSECTLSNGRKLPVSRRKYAEVRALLDRSKD
jgi:hypothetical protein